MSVKNSIRVAAAVIVLATALAGAAAAATVVVDNAIYAGLLAKYVRNGVVDYAGFKRDEARLNAYLRMLEAVRPQALERGERLAFYINAYNAWTIKLILGGYPGVKSIKDRGSLFRSPWKKRFVRLDGRMLTLDEIEHDIIRPRFKEPRIHFAVNCAARSCPPLIAEPYRGAVIEAQLEANTRAFINDPAKNRLEGDTLYLSRIFRWYAEDFKDDVVGFVRRYARGDLKRALAARAGDIRVRYLDYDWSLNGR